MSELVNASLPTLTEAFDQLERAFGRFRVGNDNSPLVVSAPPTFAARWLIGRLDDFQTRYPEIELRLLATRRLVDFNVEDVDVAVRFVSGPFTGLHAERLMPESIIPVAAPKLVESIKSASDLLNRTLLHDDIFKRDPAFPDWDTWLTSFGVTVASSLRIRRFGNTNLVIQAVTAGLGVALAWYSLVADDLHTGKLVRLFSSMLPTSHGYHLVAPTNHLSRPKVAAFREWLLDQGMRQQVS